MPLKFFKIFRYKKLSFNYILRFLKKYKFNSLTDFTLAKAYKDKSFEKIKKNFNDFSFWHKNYFVNKLPLVNVSGYADKHWGRIQFLIRHRIKTLTINSKKSLYFNI
jgi:hypothetical protein